MIVINQYGIRYLIRELYRRFKPFAGLYRFEKERSINAFIEDMVYNHEEHGRAYVVLADYQSMSGRPYLLILSPRHYDIIERTGD